MEQRLPSSAIRGSGPIEDPADVAGGRFAASAFSRLAARCADILGRRSGLAKAAQAARAASDNLKSRGFAAEAIDRVMWEATDPFPLSTLHRWERLLDFDAAVGVADSDGVLKKLRAGAGWKAINQRWLLTSEAAGLFFELDDEHMPSARGIGGSSLAGSIALSAWTSPSQRKLMGLGLDEAEAKRAIAGHELGHALARSAGHRDRWLAMAENIGVGSDWTASDLVDASEELFCDAMGALAAAPSDPARAARAIDAWRCSTTPSESIAIYLKNPERRARASQRLASGPWSAQDCARDLALECLAMSLSELGSTPIPEARAEIASRAEYCWPGNPWMADDAPGEPLAAMEKTDQTLRSPRRP